jgi:choline dehydrogenase-like flavoprotein
MLPRLATFLPTTHAQVYLARGKTLGGSSATNATLNMRGSASTNLQPDDCFTTHVVLADVCCPWQDPQLHQRHQACHLFCSCPVFEMLPAK